MDKEEEEHSSTKNEFKMERMHAAKECKASSVLNKFKEMEQKIANGEDLDEDILDDHANDDAAPLPALVDGERLIL
jgi:hypothetical protein